MASKFWKKYERILLLGLVIALTALFSITGAITGCFDQQGGSQHALGGTFSVSPTETVSVSDADFDSDFRKLNDFRVATSSIESMEYAGASQLALPIDPAVSAWNRIVLREAARDAGYRVGTHGTKAAARELMKMLSPRGTPINDVTYRNFLQQRFRGGNPAEFLEGVEDLVISDAFITPLVDSARYPRTYEDGYEQWKADRERVDLEYVALPAAPFKEIVEQEERTRGVISDVEERGRDLNRTLQTIRSTVLALNERKGTAEGGTWPASLDELETMRTPKDAWGTALRYTVDGDDMQLVSAGEDQSFDTADDVSRDTRRTVETHGNIRLVARALVEWHGATGAWPTALEDLTKPAKEGGLPALRRLVNDGFDRPFVYEAPAADGDASLTSVGADGEAGTADDVRVVVQPDTKPDDVQLPLGGGLGTLLGEMPDDAWGNPLRPGLSSAAPLIWSVTSAGEDGVFGTDDDIEGGNIRAVRDFFATPEVGPKYRRPARRQFEALYVHLPLLSDEVVAKLWEAFPEQRPTSEEELYQSWLNYRGDGLIYSAEEPGDPITGHGAELAGRIAPDAPHYLVPSEDLFPTDLDAVGGDDDEGEDGDDAEAPDPLKTEYREKGWRRILIRQRFIQNVLAEVLRRAVESEDAIEAWDEKYGDLPEHAPVPARPQRVTFDSLLADDLNPFLAGATDADKGGQTFRYFATTKPDDVEGDEWGMTREEWESHPALGDTNLSVFLGSRSDAPGGYLAQPVQIGRRLTKAIIRKIAHFPARDPQLEEVYDDVLAEYVAKRQLDRAVEELEKLRAEVPTPSDGQDPADAQREWQSAVEAWGEKLGQPYVVERTGTFIGSVPPLSVDVEDDDESDAAARQRRLNFVWRVGYDSVRPTDTGATTKVAVKTGALGRTAIPDEKPVDDGGTGAAYLVRVAQQSFPSKNEFSPERYAQYLAQAAFNPGERQGKLGDLPGAFYKSLARFIANRAYLESKWNLVTNSPLPDPEE